MNLEEKLLSDFDMVIDDRILVISTLLTEEPHLEEALTLKDIRAIYQKFRGLMEENLKRDPKAASLLSPLLIRFIERAIWSSRYACSVRYSSKGAPPNYLDLKIKPGESSKEFVDIFLSMAGPLQTPDLIQVTEILSSLLNSNSQFAHYAVRGWFPQIMDAYNESRIPTKKPYPEMILDFVKTVHSLAETPNPPLNSLDEYAKWLINTLNGDTTYRKREDRRERDTTTIIKPKTQGPEEISTEIYRILRNGEASTEKMAALYGGDIVSVRLKQEPTGYTMQVATKDGWKSPIQLSLKNISPKRERELLGIVYGLCKRAISEHVGSKDISNSQVEYKREARVTMDLIRSYKRA